MSFEPSTKAEIVVDIATHDNQDQPIVWQYIDKRNMENNIGKKISDKRWEEFVTDYQQGLADQYGENARQAFLEG